MKNEDRALGLGTSISRRDFLNGAAVAIGSSLLPAAAAQAIDFESGPVPSYYPPTLTGMRGSHDGSFEFAHALREGVSWGAESNAFNVIGWNRLYNQSDKPLGPDAGRRSIEIVRLGGLRIGVRESAGRVELLRVQAPQCRSCRG